MPVLRFAVFAFSLGSAALPAADMQETPHEVIFSRDIQPILAENCLLCHGPDEAAGGLRLDVAERALGELVSGSRAIVPGDAGASELIRRVAAEHSWERMPPKGEPLHPEQIDLLHRWIEQGAVWQEHWAYRPVERPMPPPVGDPAWVHNPIDAFVLARLEAAGITPAPEADRYTLIKRLYYDLVGLPPEPGEVDALLDESWPAAYEQLVDRLLDSPHFGERWGRHWLDKARYADSDGYEKDNPRPDAWRYRDWVIDAVNRDMPLDQFAVEQLAGDLLPDATPLQHLATAFHRQTLTNTEGGVDQEEFRVEAVFDRVETTGTVWLGLTLGCARCHTHKYDQISHHEYYRLFAFFNNADEAAREVPVSADNTDNTESAEDGAPNDEKMKVRVIAQRARPRATHVLLRGEFLEPGDEVQPGVLDVLPPLEPRGNGVPPDRLDLARWLTAADHPLTPRVAVNQIWAPLFGRGLVPTINDFGVRGDWPTHPDLLDWLAAELPRQGWSRKAMIRQIVMSATYRQASHHRLELQQLDPRNALLHRQNRFRVSGEVVRDLHLAAGGLLSRKIGGPSVFPPLPPDVAALSYADNFRWTTSSGEDRYRRGMYTFFKRTAPHPTLITFDCPDANTTSVARTLSNTPLQALVTLNNAVFVEAAQALASQLLELDSDGDEPRLAYGFRRCAVRPPEQGEMARLAELLEQSRQWYRHHPDEARRMAGDDPTSRAPVEETAAWVVVARTLMNLDTFMTRE